LCVVHTVHGENESDQKSNANREYEAPNDEEKCTSSTNKMVVFVFFFTRSPRGAGVVNGENSEKRVEKEAAYREPHVRSWVRYGLRSTRVRARNNAALGQASGAAWRAIKATTAASLLSLFRLLCDEVVRASTPVIHLLLHREELVKWPKFAQKRPLLRDVTTSQVYSFRSDRFLFPFSAAYERSIRKGRLSGCSN